MGVDRVIGCVGIKARFAEQRQKTSPDVELTTDGQWLPGDGLGQVPEWSVAVVKKVGAVGIYPPSAESHLIGKAMHKNLPSK